MSQIIMSTIEEDVFLSRMKYVRSLLNEIVEETEARCLSREEIFDKMRGVEKGLRQTRKGF